MTFYINAPTFSQATTVYTDSGLTTPAPDGYYRFGNVIRRQVGGVLLPPEVCNPCEFIFVINLEEEDLDFKLPLVISGDYDFIVDWGDGSDNRITTWNAAETEHTYSAVGNYTITIRGKIDGFGFNGSTEAEKIIEILQWGCVKLLPNAFRDAINLELDNVSDAPNLRGLTDIQQLFFGATNVGFINNIHQWDVSGVEDFTALFNNVPNFNQSIAMWDMSSAVTLIQMFKDATSFNQNLGSIKIGDNWSNAQEMFKDSGMSSENYTDTVVGWANQVYENGGLPSSVNLANNFKVFISGRSGGGNFADAGAARTYLEGLGWTIS